MSGYQDSRRCQYCANLIDPLELCDCDQSIADHVESRTTDSFHMGSRLRQAVRRIAALEAENAALKQDAERYRWDRDNFMRENPNEYESTKDFDAAIDAAMAKGEA